MAAKVSRWARVVMRVADLQYRIFDRLRHKDAFAAARRPAEAIDFSALEGRHVCLLVTYKRSGEPVPSPLLFAMADGKAYVRAESRSAKVLRIRRNNTVLIGPCTYRGRPLAPLASATARRIEGSAAQRAHDILFRSYRWFDRIYETVADRAPVDLTYLEITPGH